MAWMIKAGSVEQAAGNAAGGMSIVAQSDAGRCGWRMVAAHRTARPGHAGVASATAAHVWQDVLANLMEEESSNEQ